jgi:hypothetical protein
LEGGGDYCGESHIEGLLGRKREGRVKRRKDKDFIILWRLQVTYSKGEAKKDNQLCCSEDMTHVDYLRRGI